MDGDFVACACAARAAVCMGVFGDYVDGEEGEREEKEGDQCEEVHCGLCEGWDREKEGRSRLGVVVKWCGAMRGGEGLLRLRYY